MLVCSVESPGRVARFSKRILLSDDIAFKVCALTHPHMRLHPEGRGPHPAAAQFFGKILQRGI